MTKLQENQPGFFTKNKVSLPGKNNIIADSLSRDFHLSDKSLTTLILPFLPQQDHNNFKILTHPRNITSWLDSLRCGIHISQEFVKTPMRSNLHTLQNGPTMSIAQDYKMFGSNPFPEQIEISSLQDLHKKLEKTTTGKSKLKRNSWQTPWLPPSVLFHRPSEKRLLQSNIR